MPRAVNKSGPLARGDKEFIQNNIDTLSVDEIASHLERNPKSIINYVETNRVGKKFEVPEASDKTQNQILQELKQKPFFKHLDKQFSPEEIEYFCDYWVLTVVDFHGNILSYEELELKEWLTFEILKGRALRENKINVLRRETIKEELEQEFLKDKSSRDKDRINFLQGELTLLNEEIKKYNKDFSEIAYKADQIKKGLMKSRDNRTKDMDTAKIDFGSWIKMCQNYDIKKRVGEEMEIIKRAEQKKRKELYEYHTYADDQVDRPILNAESVAAGVNPVEEKQ